MKINLSKVATTAPKKLDKEQTKEATTRIIQDIVKLQDILIASKQKSILLILQGMDASGKDGVVKNVFKNLNPLGVRIQTFKKPTEEEFAHDFLWRIHKEVPQKGEIVIFNRSHYEDVLIQRVHKWIDEKTVTKRFDAINHFEQLLVDNGTTIIKCYMHISLEAQLERLQERKTNIEKMWKHNDQDWEERKLWKEYMQCYEDVFVNCSKSVPWNIVAVDQNWYKEYQIAVLLKEALIELSLNYPKLASK